MNALSEDLPQLWGRRGFWQVRLRWAVAPLMLLAAVLGRTAGFEFPIVPILVVAAASPVYNAVFAWSFNRWSRRLEDEPQLDRFLTTLQVLADYAAMFLLIHFTGGASSPLAVFLLFHVVIAAIQFRAAKAYQYAALAAGGLWLLLAGELSGWLPAPPIAFRGQPVHLLDRPVYATLLLLTFSATLFLTAFMVGRIMLQLRRRVIEVAHTTAELARLNRRLNSLYAMVTAIGGERRLDPVLDTVVAELVGVLEAAAVGIKLLDEDGETLRFVAAHGLPQSFLDRSVVRLEESEIDRRVLAGEVVHSRMGGVEIVPLRAELRTLGIRSAVLAPLKLEDRVLGTLGAYSDRADRFFDKEDEFLQLAAELVAIAIEDARANETVERLMADRTQFMLRTTHNLRAPLAAARSMLELVAEDSGGKGSPEQEEYLSRIEQRLWALDQTIAELLALAHTRDADRDTVLEPVDLTELADYARRTFQAKAARKRVRYAVEAAQDLPEVQGHLALLRQVMDNLVSNAIKYTPAGGEVEVSFSRPAGDRVRIQVRDSGIGIPSSEQDRLFEEFFRATNAKKATPAGTGLGLALVKQAVEHHRGRVTVTSEEGTGTTVVVRLPTGS